MGHIVVKNLYKIFGDAPERGLELLDQGLDKEAIQKQTGLTVAVQDAAFEVNDGEIFVVMGLSGSGKSTLVRMLNRLIEPTAGTILVDGRDVVNMGRDELVAFRLHTMSMVFQSFALMPHLSVLENAAFGLNLARVSPDRAAERARQALEQVGLAGWEDAYPGQLSGGMQQRVGLARALAIDPDILLMDEAFSALDPLIRTEMQDELLRLQKEHQRTVIFISHDLDEALRVGDRIAIMEGGRIVQVDTPDQILQNPANEYVKAFFRGVDPTSVISVGDIVRDTQLTIIKARVGSLRAAHELLSGKDRDFGYVLDAGHRFLGVISAEKVRNLLESGAADHLIDQGFVENVTPAHLDDSMQDILPDVAASAWPVPVVDARGIYQGVVSKNRFLRTLCRPDHGAATPAN
jgi:glycine betaine/proline transport system ATP-binding protein